MTETSVTKKKRVVDRCLILVEAEKIRAHNSTMEMRVVIDDLICNSESLPVSETPTSDELVILGSPLGVTSQSDLLKTKYIN